jgi:NitT/TauT family transport system substrate-binding protein
MLRSLAALVLAFAAVHAADPPLKVAYSDWPGWTAWEIAIQKGWFKEAGVNVEFVWMEYGPSMEAFQAGKVDAVTVTNGDQLVMGAAGKASKGIILTDYSNGNDMIVGKPGINSVKDLKGKKVGLEVGFVEHLLLLKALEANGMTEADITLVNVPTNDTPQTLASGQVDAIGAWYPVSGQALEQVPGAKPIFTSKDAPGLIYDFTVVATESLTKRKADWLKIAAIWPKVTAYLADPKTRDDGIKIMAARVNVPPAKYAAAMPGTFILDLAGNLERFAKTDGLGSVYGSSKIAHAFNLANKVYDKPLNVEDFIDPSFIQAAKK